MKYSLDKSSKKYKCPSCGKKTFVVILNEDKKIVDEQVFGRCDREDRCGYFKRPDSEKSSSTLDYLKEKDKVVLSQYAFKASVVNKYVCNYDKNNLFNFISKRFDKEKVRRIFEIYRVGVYTGLSNFDWIMFWQIDGNGWTRTAKMIKYKADGRRDKAHPPTWYHSLNGVKREDFESKQCLFGYHLKGLGKPIAVVESEKTALICALFIPKFTWMATGGKSNFRLLNGLKGEDVTLFPDLGAFDIWKEKAEAYNLKISDYIEKIATKEDRDNGYDIADFLMR